MVCGYGCRIYVDFMTGENCRQILLLPRTLFIGQFIHPVGGEGIWGIVILASYKLHFIKVHDYLV